MLLRNHRSDRERDVGNVKVEMVTFVTHGGVRVTIIIEIYDYMQHEEDLSLSLFSLISKSRRYIHEGH